MLNVIVELIRLQKEEIIERKGNYYYELTPEWRKAQKKKQFLTIIVGKFRTFWSK